MNGLGSKTGAEMTRLNAIARENGFPDYATMQAFYAHRDAAVKKPQNYLNRPGLGAPSQRDLPGGSPNGPRSMHPRDIFNFITQKLQDAF